MRYTSGAVRRLVAGSNINFEDRDDHGLKGIPGLWHLYSVVVVHEGAEKALVWPALRNLRILAYSYGSTPPKIRYSPLRCG